MTTGIRLTQRAVTKCAAGLCAEQGPVRQTYEALRSEIVTTLVVNADGYLLAHGRGGFLSNGFFSRIRTVYQIRSRPR